ncbi:MAG: DUF1178 family protein [Rhodospirillales bacterium]|nr:DUF1178 family protein [Rhodospirillales bacterium]
MIVYQVKCSNGHEFEGWFRNSGVFDQQRKRGDIDCPLCGDTEVSKAPMAPHVARSSGRSDATHESTKEAPAQAAATIAQLRTYVEKHCDYVGESFPAEARRIHYGEVEKRSIYGEASSKEVSRLTDEGIEVHQLPTLPRRND